MSRVIHFEIHADEPQRAVDFYQHIFDWQINKWEGPADYWLITTGPDTEAGINGAIVKRPQPISGNAANAFVCTIDVPSVDDAIAKITSQGGTIELPKWQFLKLVGSRMRRTPRAIFLASCRAITRLYEVEFMSLGIRFP